MANVKLMHGFDEAARDYTRIERALSFLVEEAGAQPSLDRLADEVGLSSHHFQRVFQRWAGVSPKRFLQYLTKEHALSLLARGDSVFDTAIEVGLSGPSRLHDLLVVSEAATPGELRNGGRGLELGFDFSPSPFGLCLVVESPRGLSMLSFVGEEDETSARLEIARRFPEAGIQRRRGLAASWIEPIFRPTIGAHPLRLHLFGTQFQLKVWQALLSIPEGSLSTYAALAKAVGQPAAARAVGTAVGQNPIAFLIPCHRVIRAVGTRGGYRWGPIRKAALIGLEQARTAR